MTVNCLISSSLVCQLVGPSPFMSISQSLSLCISGFTLSASLSLSLSVNGITLSVSESLSFCVQPSLSLSVSQSVMWVLLICLSVNESLSLSKSLCANGSCSSV